MPTNDSDSSKPDACIDHTDPETLRRLYWDEGLSTREIAERATVTSGGIQHWMDKHGIEKRSISEANTKIHATFETSVNGYEGARDCLNSEVVKIHRLVAVAEYGLDALRGKHIHHGNNIPWDNRPSNLVPMAPNEHHAEHHNGEKSPNSKLSREQAKEIKNLATEGDMIHAEISDMFGVERSTVTMIKNGTRWESLE